MRFRVAPEVFEKHPDIFIAVVAASEVANGEPVPAAEEALRAAEREARERLTADDLQDHPFIARWRDAFRAESLNPNKYKSSVEALLARVLKGSAVPLLAPAVNLANSVSLRYVLPVGAHDADQLSGDLAVRPTTGEETFRPIGEAGHETVEAGEIAYADDAEVRTRRWVWRQGDGSKVTGQSSRIIFPIDGWRGLNEEDVRAAADVLARLLQEHTGARTAVSFVSRERPEVVVFEDGAPVAMEANGAAGGAPAVHVAEREPDAIDEALTRGVVDVIERQNLERRMRAGEKLRVKLGIDPTGPRLHIGRAVTLRKLRAFQDLGHTVCLIIGDFTAQVGDVSGHTSARRILSELEIYQNMATYKEQMGRILDESKVEWHYNSDWLGQLRFKDVIELAKLFTVAQMLERENFSQRYAEGKPISLQEFMYPLMQGYDSYAIDADLEIGGTDQLFNLMAGRTVQARGFGKPPQDIITMQMIWGLDGRQMSTSRGNTILIADPPRDMYGKVMSMNDEHIIPYFEVATDVPLREVREIERELAGGLNPMQAKKRLAYEITRLYHGDAGALEGEKYFEELHQSKGELSDDEWPEVALDGEPRQVGKLFKDAGLTESIGDARRVASQGGLEIDGQKVIDIAAVTTPVTGMKLRRGKNKLARLKVT